MDFVAAAGFKSCCHGVMYVVCCRVRKGPVLQVFGLQVVVVGVIFCLIARGNSQIALLLPSR